jgi:HPt (histidine-containing phosphotransfer) domain-containing protein
LAPPVDLERISDLTGGDIAGLKELVTLHFELTARQIRQIEVAIRNNLPEDMCREAHSCGGASATLGMTQLGAIFKEMELQGKAGRMNQAADLCRGATKEVERVRAFLTPLLEQLD